MPINTSGAIGAPLTVYGSWVTDVSPDALPENTSPDNQEIVYAAGQMGSRPAFQTVTGITFPAVGGVVPTGVYGKSFVTPTGDVKNLYLDSAGRCWVEDFTNSPGSLTILLQSTPGSYCKSITKFGREYLAISDGLHGTEVPLQFDGALLRRVTQGGPATPPKVNSLSIPPSSVTTSGGGGSSIPISSIVTDYPVVSWEGPVVGYVTYYTAMTITFISTPPFTINQSIGVSGNSQSIFNTTGPIVAINGLNVTVSGSFGSTYLSGGGGSVGVSITGNSLVRSNNLLNVVTATPHSLKIGYQALLQNNGSLTVGTSITSIVINNEQNAGIATVTTSTAHGLSVNQDVTITGVTPQAVGGAWSASWDGAVTTMTSGSAHGLIPGAVVSVSGDSTGLFNTSVTVNLVPSPNTISFNAYYMGTAPLTASGLTVSLTWPIPDNTPTPTYFEVQACPTPTTFQVQVTYTDGTWSSGIVGFPWDGTFYVTSIPSATSFICQSPGPNGTTSETTGTVTPFGQSGAGLHLVSVAYLTDQGAITAPSPFATFITNGGQYLSISNIPIGPSNVVARILLFTGAQPDVPGELPPFYYIPVIPMLEGQIIGTATQINDNVTTSALLDFADSTLYAAIGASIPGNDLANQIVLDGALGFRTYLSRLITMGQRNTIQNMLNPGFDADASGATAPQGWTVTGNGGTVLALSDRPAGGQWKFSNTSISTALSQSAYLDCYGDPIFTGNLTYKIRVWLKTYFVGAGGPNFVATLSSASTGYSSTATILNAAMSTNGSFLEATFTLATPLNIPNDFIFSIANSVTGTAYTLIVDELWPIPTETPYLENLSYTSYVNNPEGIDGTTGQWGPNDTAKIMDMGIVRGTLNVLTQAPNGKLHSTGGSTTTEPSGWEVEPVAGECGALSAFTLTTSQADDSTQAGSDDWMAWASDVGAMIYGGGVPEKISQEIQPNWNDPTRSDKTVQINMAAATTVWALNDPISRLLFFGLPIGTASSPSQIYVLNYEHLASAQAIAGSPPFHPSFAGKLIATDNSRKWTHWLRPMNGAARMYRSAGKLTNVFFGGNGQTLGAAAGYGNIYTLNPAKLTDDDFGQIYPYYVTYFFVDPERRQQMQLKNGRLLLAYILAQIQPQPGDTNSQITLTYYGDNLANPWPLTTTRILTPNFWKDRNFGGGMAQGERIAIKIASSPITGTDNSFVCSRLEAFLRNARLLVSGVNQ